MFKQILVPLDGSPLSEFALTAAKALAAKFDGEITLLRATSTPIFLGEPDSFSYAELMNEIRQQNLREIEAYLKGIKGSLRQEGYKVHTQLVENSAPANAILATAEGQPIDVIVMSTHGRGGVSRWVYGSVADKVLRHSSVPVLLIRPQPTLEDKPKKTDQSSTMMQANIEVKGIG